MQGSMMRIATQWCSPVWTGMQDDRGLTHVMAQNSHHTISMMLHPTIILSYVASGIAGTRT